MKSGFVNIVGNPNLKNSRKTNVSLTFSDNNNGRFKLPMAFVNIFLSLKTVNAIFIISLETSAKSFYAMDSLFYRYEKIRMLHK